MPLDYFASHDCDTIVTLAYALIGTNVTRFVLLISGPLGIPIVYSLSHSVYVIQAYRNITFR